VCNGPSFKVATGSPYSFKVDPAHPGLPNDLASGTFFFRRGDPAPCGCDLAVALAAPGLPRRGFLMLMQGNKDGTFTQIPGVSQIGFTDEPVAVASGRFRNSDSNVDGIVVVTSRGASGSAAIFLFDPITGTYQQSKDSNGSAASWQVGMTPVALTTGDFDGDGNLDIAIANKSTRSVTILFGTGNGQFAPTPTVVAVGGEPSSLAAGKFAGPGAPDAIAVGMIVPSGDAPQSAVGIVHRAQADSYMIDPPFTVGARGSTNTLVAAANLSTSATAPAVWRDLVVALTDQDGSGTPRERVKLLLGQEGAPPSDAGSIDFAARVSSIKVVDLDQDGVVDLIVATHGETASSIDGTVQFFKGTTGGPSGVGFNQNPDWHPIQGDPIRPLRPKSLVAGRFGRNSEPGKPANPGFAHVNAANLNTVSAYVGNGRGGFVEPTITRTNVQSVASLIATGQFHAAQGSDALQDFAYVAQNSQHRNIVSALLSNGAGGFDEPSGNSSFAGIDPRLIVVGHFQNPNKLDVAVVDSHLDEQQGVPLLKVFLGDRSGHFAPGPGLSDFFINEKGPAAAVAGRFRSTAALDDIVVVSADGQVRLFRNDGQGQFPEDGSKLEHPLEFRPGAVLASDKLQPGGKLDLIVHDLDHNELRLLSNRGDGQFLGGGRLQQAGNVDTIATGDLRNETTAPEFGNFHDIVTIDDDMTIRVFANDNSGGFTPAPPVISLVTHFALAAPRIALQDLGGARISLVITVRQLSDQTTGVLTLQSDGHGGFEEPRFSPVDLPFDANAALVSTSATTILATPNSTTGVETVNGKTIDSLIPGRFTNTALGSNRADLALLIKISTHTLASGACPTTTPSASAVAMRLGGAPRISPAARHCHPDPNSFPGECHVPHQPCMICDDDGDGGPTLIPFCQTDKIYSYLLVLDSSCGG
jgi:hypothetical protein